MDSQNSSHTFQPLRVHHSTVWPFVVTAIILVAVALLTFRAFDSTPQLGQYDPVSVEFMLLDDNASDSNSEGRYVPTGLTEQHIRSARLDFNSPYDSADMQYYVLVQFNEEGTSLLAQTTANHIGDRLVIFVDGVEVSGPIIREAITGGAAVISGDFTVEEARAVARKLDEAARMNRTSLEDSPN